MRELHATAVVDESGELELRLHTDLPPGKHRFKLLVLDEPAANGHKPENRELPHYSVGGILPDFSIDREDWYRDGEL